MGKSKYAICSIIILQNYSMVPHKRVGSRRKVITTPDSLYTYIGTSYVTTYRESVITAELQISTL